MPTDEMTADQVRAVRAGLGLTQEAFAGRLGVSLRAVQHWEGGARKPRGPACTLIRSLSARKPARNAAKR